MAGKHTVVSLFSGGGGLDIGLEQSGRTRLLACCEKEAAFCATLRANHEAGRLGGGPLAVVEADISSLSLMCVSFFPL
jgi:DNA (cytosine-5)-methyltransferase 1